MKTCTKCSLDKDRSEFRDHKAYKDGKVSWCKSCQLAKTREWKQVNKVRSKEYERWHKRETKYGVTEQIYNAMFSDQNGLCKICKSTPENSPKGTLYVDHCHTTGKVRGLLCDHCNNLLGRAKDSISVLQEAIKYLEE